MSLFYPTSTRLTDRLGGTVLNTRQNCTLHTATVTDRNGPVGAYIVFLLRKTLFKILTRRTAIKVRIVPQKYAGLLPFRYLEIYHLTL